MVLNKITINELKSIFDLLTSYNDYIVKNIHINEHNKTQYTQWINKHNKVQEKLKMVYNEINKRIDLIKE